MFITMIPPSILASAPLAAPVVSLSSNPILKLVNGPLLLCCTTPQPWLALELEQC